MIDRLAFGRTGHLSSRIIFGAAALGGGRQDVADRILADVVALGINHIDTAAGYGDSELRLAPWLKSNRAKVFLATKTGERIGTNARRQLEQSLTRLDVDHVDLIQLHNLVEEDEWETAFAPGGAVEALGAARDEGLVRFVGVTGHGLRIPGMHVRSLERFDFDSVLFPWNHALAGLGDYRRGAEGLMSLCRAKNVAMQTIKSVAKRRWEDPKQPHFSWYEPLDDADAISRAVRFVLSTPDLFLNSSSDARLLHSLVNAATATNSTTRPTDDELTADVFAQNISPLFDGNALERI